MKNIYILVIQIFCYENVLVWFLHAILLVKSGRQFICKIMSSQYCIIRFNQIRLNWLIFCIRFVWQTEPTTFSGKFDENNYWNMQNTGVLTTWLNI